MKHKKKINLLMVYPTFFPIKGGAETQIRLMCDYLLSKGHSAEVFTQLFHGMKKKEKVGNIRVNRAYVTSHKLLKQVLFPLKFFIYMFFNKKKYDIIHFHGFGRQTCLVTLIGKIFRKPVVIRVTLYGDATILFTSKLGSFWRKLALKIDKIVYYTAELKNELIRNGIPEHKLVKILSGEDTELFKPVTPKEKTLLKERLGLPRKRIFVFAGRLVERKGLVFLIEIWKDMLKEFRDITLVLLGTGKGEPDSVEEKIKRMARDYNIEDDVLFLGDVDNVYEYFQASDFLVFPSKKEGLPNTLLEAMSTGVIPIASVTESGAGDVIKNGDNGFLVESENHGQYISTISSLLKMKDDELNRIRMSARKKILKDHSAEAMGEKYIRLYYAVMER